MTGLRHPDIHPFARFDVPRLVEQRARTRADHPFLVWAPFDAPSQSWTYAGFRDRVRRLAAGLARRGIKAGDKVLVHLDNCPETIFAWYACAELGAIAVTTNARSAPDELAYFAAHSEAVAAITQPKFAELVNAAHRDARFLAVTSHDAGAAPAAGPPRPSFGDRGGGFGGPRPPRAPFGAPRERAAPAPLGPAEEMEGTVKWYRAEKGFGFVTASDGGKDVFVHLNVLRKAGLASLEPDQQVVMSVVTTAKGREAQSIRLV